MARLAFLLGLFLLASLPAAAQQVLSPMVGPSVVSNAALKTFGATSGVVYRQGFTTPGDGGDAVYLYQAGACPLNAGNGDDGSQVKASGSGCWIAQFPSQGADVRQWGAKPDAVPGAIGAACTGITGTDNTATLQAAINHGMTTGTRIIAGGTGYYRANARLDFTPTVQYWNANKKAPDISFQQPLVSCGNDAAVWIHDEADGARIAFAQIVGKGAGSTAPIPGSHAENAGILMEGAGWWNVSVDEVMDFTYNVLLDGSYGNKVHVGTAIASYKAIYLRDGAPSTQCAGCGSAANQLTLINIGGPYNASGDATFAARQARSSYWGLHISGTGQGNNVSGGAIQYSTKPGGINLEVNASQNFVIAWVEGHATTGKNLVVTGNDNVLRLSALTSPSAGMTTNVSVGGIRNSMWAPLELTGYGLYTVAIKNFVNGSPVQAEYTPTVTCSGGAPTTASAIGRYRFVGPLVWVQISWSTTNIGTCTGVLQASLPIAASPTYNSVLNGINMTSSNQNTCRVDAGASVTGIRTSTGTFPAANGNTGICSGFYDIE